VEIEEMDKKQKDREKRTLDKIKAFKSSKPRLNVAKARDKVTKKARKIKESGGKDRELDMLDLIIELMGLNHSQQLNIEYQFDLICNLRYSAHDARDAAKELQKKFDDFFNTTSERLHKRIDELETGVWKRVTALEERTK
jgi:hypothetical protein